MSQTVKSCDPEKLRDWYLSLPDKAKKIAVLARNENRLSAYKLLKRYFESQDLSEAFSGSTTFNFPFYTDEESLDILTKSHIEALGRRCSSYLKSISYGLEAYAANEGNDELLNLTKDILLDSVQLNKACKRIRHKADTLLRSINDGHGIINYHVTYLDPVLFSSLYALRMIGNKFIADQVDLDKYNEAGIEAKDDFDKIQRKLIEIIKDEISLYIIDGDTKSIILADESTLWWGVYELIQYSIETENAFEACKIKNEDKYHYVGIPGAARLIQKLAKWTMASASCPDFDKAKVEATSEIHCPLRTLLWIANIGIKLCRIPWPDDVREQVLPSLKVLINWSLLKALESWNTNPYLQKHAYFIGLTLEVLCNYESFVRDFEDAPLGDEARITKEDEAECYYARIWTSNTGEKGEPISENQYNDLIKNICKYDIFIINKDEMKMDTVGAVFLKSAPFSTKAKKTSGLGNNDSNGNGQEKYLSSPTGYKILCYTLKEKGCPGEIYNFIRNCWDESAIAAEIKNNFIKMRSGELGSEQFYSSTGKYRKAIGEVSKFLQDNMGGVELTTGRKRLYRLVPPVSYCMIEISN